VLGYAHVGVRPEVMRLCPIPAVRNLMERTGLTSDDFDVIESNIESNEVFASQALALNKELGLDPARATPNGGSSRLAPPARSCAAKHSMIWNARAGPRPWSPCALAVAKASWPRSSGSVLVSAPDRVISRPLWRVQKCIVVFSAGCRQ